MIIGIAEAKDGKKMLILGLSAENITRLKAGDPIYKRTGDPLGFHLVIEYAETEKALVAKLTEIGLTMGDESEASAEMEKNSQAQASGGADPDPGGN